LLPFLYVLNKQITCSLHYIVASKSKRISVAAGVV